MSNDNFEIIPSRLLHLDKVHVHTLKNSIKNIKSYFLFLL
jgi:hypothetical protein